MSQAENFQGLYDGSYSSGTFTVSATSGKNKLPGNGKVETVTGSTATINPGDTVTLSSTAAGGVNGSYIFVGDAFDGSGTSVGIVVRTGTTYLLVDLSNAGNLKSKAFTVKTEGWNLSSGTVVTCFMAGTMVATPDGEVAVETLKAGDLVSLADGGAAPVTWLGRQTVRTVFADKLRVNPIRIKADALAAGVPARDLLVSPGHALLVDGILAHAGALVNGISILRETAVAPVFTYYHVEVANHALILAENAPAESFIDNVDRMGFDNWDEHPGGAEIPEMELPRAKSARQVPDATLNRLQARAVALYGAAAEAA